MTRFSSVHAFVVEDNAFQRHGLVSMLRAIGLVHVDEAVNGREALSILQADRRHAPVDVILCDLEMPEMDGIEFLRAVAEQGLARAVVIISGREPEILTSVEAMVCALGMNVLGKLGKPVSPQDLRGVLSRDVVALPSRGEQVTALEPAELRRALAAREFRCEFQPKVRLDTGEMTGVEVLARWRTATGLSVPPGEFVPVMVRERLTDVLTVQMLDGACRALNAWDRQGVVLSAAVNVSMSALSDLGTADRFAAQASAHGIQPRRITFEVTETEIMSKPAAVLNVLARMRLSGFRLAIDDFGTGYASLAHLNKLPFTELKIDQSFVRNCGQSTRLRDIVLSSIELARRLSIRTVAEGIESRDEWDFLASSACDEGQGYFIARPMSEPDIPGFARQRRLVPTP